jgi:hypothetical protein
VVGEVGTETGSPLQGLREVQASRRHLCHRSTLVEFTRLTERSRCSVAAIRFTAARHAVRRPRGFPEIVIRCRSTGSSHRLGFSSRAHLQVSAGVLRGSSYLHEVCRPYSDVGAEVHITRVSTPGSFRLQGFSPS